jgi:hypothetical protein
MPFKFKFITYCLLKGYKIRNTLEGNVDIRIPRYETLRVTEFGQTVSGGEPIRNPGRRRREYENL